MYIRALCNRLTRFAGIATRQILECFYLTYGDISAKDLADNHTKMNSLYDLNQPIEHLIDQIDEAVELVDTAKVPYTAVQVVDIAYHLIQETGIFTLDCKKWNEASDIDKTYINFKTFFADSYKKWRRSRILFQRGGGGYHEANLLTTETTETTETLGKMATVIEQDRQSVPISSANGSNLKRKAPNFVYSISISSS